MAYEFYMKVRGRKQGDFKGESSNRLWSDWIPCYGLNHQMQMPTEAQSGVATGRVVPHPLTITKAVGAASPQLYSALCTNEILVSVDLSFVRRTPDASETVYFTISLKNAGVVGAALRCAGDLGLGPLVTEVEDFSFRYETVTWSHKAPQTEATYRRTSRATARRAR